MNDQSVKAINQSNRQAIGGLIAALLAAMVLIGNSTAQAEESSAPASPGASGGSCEQVTVTLPDGDNMIERIAEVLTTTPLPLRTTVRGLLRNRPADFVERIEALVALDVPEPAISQQCECLPDNVSAADMFSGALTAQVNPNLLARHCLEFIPAEAIPDVIVEALSQLQTVQYASFFREVNETLIRTGLDGREVLVESLIESGFLSEEDIDAGCVGDCITPLAEALVDSLLSEDTGDGPGDGPGEIDDPEEPFSSS